MTAEARTALVALALAGFVAAVVVLSRSPDASRTQPVAAAAAPIRNGPPPAEPISEVVPDDPPALPKPIATEPSRRDVVLPGLRWLQARQAPDGSWHDPATTGLALLAFLGAGVTHNSASHRPTVKAGLKYLRDVQDAEGCLAPRGSARMLRDHAIAALALVEDYGMTGGILFKEPAQRAVAFALKSRTPSAGWTRPDGRLDFETTVWMAMLLRSARESRFDVDAGALPDAVAAINRSTDWNGRVVAPDPGMSDEAATAMGVLVRRLGDRTPDTDIMVRRGAEFLAANPPAWREGRLADPAAWYFGTSVMSSLYRERWKSWAEAMLTVVDRAEAGADRGELRGSWDPPDASASDADRVRTTALVLLGLERAFYAYKAFVK